MKKVVAAFAFALTLSAAASVQAQAPDKLLALYVYNFACNAQWPTTDQEFVIGVLSHSGMTAELETVTRNRTLKGQAIRVVNFQSVAEIKNCQVLYIPGAMSESFLAVESQLAHSSTLIVTDEPGMGKAGSGLNFVTVNGKLRFEVNVEALEQRGLRLAPEIVELGMKVESTELPHTGAAI